MGLFSHTVTTVGTSVARVIDDKMVPDSIKTGAMRSIIADDDQLVGNAMEELMGGLGNKTNRMYEYGRDRYIFGLPSATAMKSDDAKPLVQAAIAAEASGPVTLDYYHFGAFNNLHVGWFTLVNNFGYSHTTNEIATLSASKGTKVYLKDMVVVVKEANLIEMGNGSLDQWGSPPNGGFVPQQRDVGVLAGALTAHSPFMVDPVAAADYVKVTYAWEESTQVVVGTSTNFSTGAVSNVYATQKTVKEASFNILVSSYDAQADYHQVRYTRAGVSKYWLYKAGSGTYPAIDASYQTTHAGDGSYFPFGYFRYNKVSAAFNKDSAEYKSSKKLVNYLGMDFDQLIDGIHANPDIDQVENAMLMLAVPADTKNAMEQRYLFDYFNRLVTQVAPISAADLAVNNQLATLMKGISLELPLGSIVIQDKRFKMALTYRNVFKHRVAGVIGKKGSYASGYSETMQSESGVNTATGAAVPFSTKVPCHFYQFQVSETMYEEVQVYNLKSLYYVFESFIATAQGKDSNLLIPLDYSLTRPYHATDREVLYARSMYYVFNSRVVTRLKWYETAFFRALLVIAAIVMTVISIGETWQTIVAALAAGAAAEVIVILILTQLLEYLLISLAVKVFVHVFGQKVAFIAALVLALYGGYEGLKAGSLKGSPWAQELLQMSSALIKGVNNDIKNDFDGLAKEREDFNLFVEQENKKLDEANKLLENDNPLIPMVIFGESPKDYYERTVHSGNIGVLSLDAISNYVDISLTLPKLNDTVGETIYGRN